MADRETEQTLETSSFSYPSSFDDDFESNLDFDFYPEDITILSESLDLEEENIPDFQEDDSPLDEIIDYADMPSSFQPEDDFPEDGELSAPFLHTFSGGDDDDVELLTEDSLDEILQRPLPKAEELAEEEPRGLQDEEGSIGLSPEELSRLESDDFEDYVDSDTKIDEDFAKEIGGAEDDTNITLGADELANLLHSDYSDSESFEEEDTISPIPPDDLIYQHEATGEDNIEVDFDSPTEAPSLFASESEEDITLNTDELHNIVDGYEEESEEYGKSFFDSDEDLDDDIFGETPYDSDELQEETFGEEGKSFFDEENDSITLSADELGNISNDEEIEDESITLSLDELGNITGDEEIIEDFTSDFGEEDESITLSPDELGNITGDEEVVAEEFTPDFGEEDDSITLSPDELGNITGDEEVVAEEFTPDFGEEDDSITLSPDELGNITGDEEVVAEEFTPDFGEEDDSITLFPDELGNITGDEEVVAEEFTPDFGEEDDSITLSPDELGNITGDEEVVAEEFTPDFGEEDDSITLSPDELGNITGDEEVVAEEFTPDFGEEDDSITLSPDELGNITGDEEIVAEEFMPDFGEEDDSITLSPDELGNITGDDDLPEFSDEDDSITLSPDELGNIMEEDPLPDYGLYDSPTDGPILEPELPPTEKFEFKSVKKQDLQKLMSFLDEKLGAMPEEFVEDFAKSEYFELYKKIMNELDL